MTNVEMLNEGLQGLVRCECGCKYWENLKCIDCGGMIENLVMHDEESGRIVLELIDEIRGGIRV